ncbi:MAG: ABC transporter substrate-binding protein [Candidatus Rokubacteria bacterium]|nr:ABC transporter substrate-binding protein [Candidatus Rokubacteria bacterium]MBI2158261.1 ABC transporter substrate-binding protein [Candidatus Rokubacteria bacterium]MBI2493257.1 ABC transporter substrate-binding protein [Candidatus Rokubacteria bacterium]
MERRRFLVKAGGALVAAGAAVAIDAPNVIAQPKFQWRMATSWTPALDVLQGNAQRFAKMVDEMSGGRLKIQVFAAGELIPAFGVFDGCSQGTIEAYNSAAYYWAGKEAACQWFTSVPFGMNPKGQYVWYYYGDGLKLWEEAYKPFNLVPRPSASTGVQMAGWFRKKINTMADYRGLKMRIPGLGGKVVAAAGGTVVLTPGGEIYTALERGVIDASEWVGPHDDMKLGLHQTARYYYYPGWHEPGTTGEFVFNQKAYSALPVDIQRILDHACTAMHTLEFGEYDAKNIVALAKLRTEFKAKVEILPIPADVMRELKKLAVQVNKEESEKSAIARKTHDSYNKFAAGLHPWDVMSEAAYQNLIAG